MRTRVQFPSAALTNTIGYRGAAADTTEVVNNRWVVERGSERASEEEERAEEAEETVVRSQLLQGKFIHDLQGRHKNKGQEGDDRIFSVLLVCQHLCQADTHHLSRHTNTTIKSQLTPSTPCLSIFPANYLNKSA